MLSALFLSHTWVDQFDQIKRDLDNELDKLQYNMDKAKHKIDRHTNLKYFHSITRDVFDSATLYRIDVDRMIINLPLHLYPYFKPALFKWTHSEFMSMYYRLYKILGEYELDVLKQMSSHIEQMWNHTIKILQLHHELVCSLPIDVVVPKYYYMYDLIACRVHTNNKYESR